MAFYKRPQIEETIKSFLIVGETLNGAYGYVQYQYRNLISFIVVSLMTVFSFTQIKNGSIWGLFAFSFMIGAFYFLINFRININYAITKFRVIRIVEGSIITKFIFKSSRMTGFTDLHYEHVERISIETPSLSIPRLYLSLIGIAFGWLLIDDISMLNANTLTIQNLIAVSVIIAGLINIMFTIPTGGVKLVLQSVSGDNMEFPEKQTPEEFIDKLIFNCRTFLSYGAV